ncbi:39791_t:CDS:1 [Gigaspora margarita]|uniref:39791_t:CDS:1 n=1 Tax=Gigaspora margarita TaxID=4874 RepID=A0ABN7W023_GIGMA|nr:39791_t:CDS:1 [Gigaspora margarita]
MDFFNIFCLTIFLFICYLIIDLSKTESTQEVFNEYLPDGEIIQIIYVEELDNNLPMEEENSLLKTKLNKSSDFTLKGFNSLQQEIERIRKENLLLKQENELLRNECLLLKQENERVRNEYLLLKKENEQIRNDNKVLKTTINRTNFTNLKLSSDKNKIKRIFANLEIERLLNKLKLFNPLLADIWYQFFKKESNIEIIELKIKYLDNFLIPEIINKYHLKECF